MRLLRALAWIMGVAIALIGLYHLVGGLPSVPGTGSVHGLARATVDSRERFYNPIFLGYGLAWIWVARQQQLPLKVVDALAAIFLLGGIGRVVSVLVYGWPHWFQIPLAALELIVPLAFFALTAVQRRRVTTLAR